MKGYLTYLIVFFTTGLFAQEYSFRNYNIDNGLPSATVFEIFQSSRGYLWFGTESNGVCRFDGLNFETYNTTNGLGGNTIRSIVEDESNRLWFATDNGITVFDGLSFKHISMTDGLSGNAVVSLFIDSKNYIWAGIAGEQGGLNRIKFANGSVVINTYLSKSVYSKNAIFTILEDSLNTIWVGSFGGGLYHSIMLGDSISFIPFNKTAILSNYILCSEIGQNGTLLFGTYDKGLFQISPDKNADNSQVSIIPVIYESNIKRIWDIKVEKDEILLASNEYGLIRLKKNKLQRIEETNGLPGNQILKIFRDNSKNLWVSTYEKGISMFNSEQIFRISTKTNSLKYNMLDVKKQGDILWIGTNKNGLIRHDLSQNTNIEFNSSNSLISNHISSIDFDKQGNLWLGSSNGVYKIFGKQLINLTVKDGLVNDEVNTILVDSYNNIWCGTKGGVSKINGDSISNSHVGTGLINNEVTCLFEDADSNIWVGTMGGLAMFSLDGVLHNFDHEEGLMEKKIQVVNENNDGILIIGTAGGGIYLATKINNKYRFIYYELSDLLISKNITFLETSSNTLLVGTDKGICRLIYGEKKNAAQIDLFNNNTGFLGNKCNLNASVLTNDILIVGAINGVYIFNNILNKPEYTPTQVNITNIKLFYEDVDWQAMGFSTEKWSRAPKQLELGYKNKNLTFEYSAIRYKDPEGMEYTCRIKQLDDIWPPYTKEKYKQFSNIHPGKYTLQVKAKYNGHESDICEYNFKINPPFWNTLVFKICSVLFVMLLFWFILKWREGNLIKEKIRLDKLVKERTREVVEQKEVIEVKSQQIIDSINYAKNIQNALLPNEESLHNFFDEHFILFKPRDIVSGDFYWHSVQDNKMIIVAADCTGHGVPGAFMSMLGISFLNAIINEKKIFEPDIILNKLRQNIISALKQHGELGESADGMDISLLVFEADKQSCKFAGANNDLYIIRDGNLQVIKADRMPIAFYPTMNMFSMQQLELQKNDVLYIYSDGFIDQIGGPNNKKIMKSNFKNLIISLYQLPFAEQKKRLNKYFEEWCMTEEQLDDVLVIGLKV